MGWDSIVLACIMDSQYDLSAVYRSILHKISSIIVLYAFVPLDPERMRRIMQDGLNLAVIYN